MGWGLVTLPQRGDSSLYLWDRRAKGENTHAPVQKFEGHTDQVKEFLWRTRGGADSDRDDREFQLVTWSKDQTLRLWPLSNETLSQIGHDATKPIRFRQTRRGAVYKSYRPETEEQKAMPKQVFSLSLGNAVRSGSTSTGPPGYSMTKPGTVYKGFSPVLWMRGVRMTRSRENPLVDDPSWTSETLHLGEEFPAIELKFPKLKFEEASVKHRSCTMTLQGPWGVDEEVTFLRLKITFPAGYPAMAVPTFELDRTNAITAERHLYIIDSLSRISQRYRDRSRPSLEALVRFLLGENVLDERFDDEIAESDSSSDDDLNVLFPYSDEVDNPEQQNVPLPRSCAAVFCGTKLVTFFSGVQEVVTRPSTPQLALAPTQHRGQRLFPSFGHLKGHLERPSEIESDDEYDLDDMASSRIVDPHLHSKRGSASISERISTKRPFSLKSVDHKTEHNPDYVSIRDFSQEMLINPNLAAEWSMNHSADSCAVNAERCIDADELELAEAWEVAALILENEDVEQDPDVQRAATLSDALFGRDAIAGQMMDHFSTQGNLQMVATLSCVLSTNNVVAANVEDGQKFSTRPMIRRQSSSFKQVAPPTLSKSSSKTDPHDLIEEVPVRELAGSYGSAHGPGTWLGRLQSKGSSQQAQLLENYLRTAPTSLEKSSNESKRLQWQSKEIINTKRPGLDIKMITMTQTLLPSISPDTQNREQAARSAYSDLLYKLQLNTQRCEVLSHSVISLPKADVDVHRRCSNCYHSATKRCIKCHGSPIAIKCSICMVSMKGRIAFCGNCEHASHPTCLAEWYKDNELCPTGCNCNCQVATELILLDAKVTNEIRQFWRTTANVPRLHNKFK